MGLHTHILELDRGVIPLSGSSGPGHVHAGVYEGFGGEFVTTPADDMMEHVHYIRVKNRNIKTGTPVDIDPPSEMMTTPQEKRFPRVLTFEAVRDGWLPDSGSGLPQSLEDAVPGELEFWKAENRDDALAIRRGLVELGLITPNTVRMVSLKRDDTLSDPVPMVVQDGEIVWSADKSQSPLRPDFRSNSELAKEATGISGQDARILDTQILSALLEFGKADFSDILTGCLDSGGEWLIEVPSGSSQEETLLKRYDGCTAFRLNHSDETTYISSGIPADGVRFLTAPSELVKSALDIARNMSGVEIKESLPSLGLTDYQKAMGEALVEMVQKSEWTQSELRAAHRIRIILESELAKNETEQRADLLKALGVDTDRAGHSVLSKAQTVKIMKFSDGSVPTERLLYGVVLEPDVVDLQRDVLSTQTIKNAFYDYVENHRQIGIQHQEIVEGACRITQVFLAPCDFTPPGMEGVIKEGSWVMEYRVLEDDLWKSVLAGEFTGFSIGGNGRRSPQ